MCKRPIQIEYLYYKFSVNKLDLDYKTVALDMVTRPKSHMQWLKMCTINKCLIYIDWCQKEL